jgi:hypothetical protein
MKMIMKNSSVSSLLLIVISILFNCCEKENTSVKADLSIRFGTFNLFDTRIDSVLKEYIQTNKDGIPKVYTMVVQREDISTTSITLCSITRYSELYNLIPSGYFKIDDDIVLTYTGLETMQKPDSSFIKELEKVVANRIEDDLLLDRRTIDPNRTIRIYDQQAWEIRLTKKTVVVNRDSARNTLAPPIVDVIKFVPPKKK